jgi:hypothetical protein
MRNTILFLVIGSLMNLGSLLEDISVLFDSLADISFYCCDSLQGFVNSDNL